MREKDLLVFEIMRKTVSGKDIGVVGTVKGETPLEAARVRFEDATLEIMEITPAGISYDIISAKIPEKMRFWLIPKTPLVPIQTVRPFLGIRPQPQPI